jgi:Glycosyl hydrolase family 12
MAFRSLKVALLAAAVVASAAVPASNATADSNSGVPTYNKDVCGTHWVKVHNQKNSYYNFYNAPPEQAYTCIRVEKYHLVFSIRKAGIVRAWGYPNISSGWEANRYSCTGVKGRCMKYPVQEKHDGYPLTSVETWLSPGVYNASYDIWFNRTDAHPSQNNGTEIMIWLAHPGLDDSHAITRYVTIDGIHWGVMDWTAFNPRAGVSWHYVAFMAVHQRSSVFRMWLNPFFRNAIANGELSPNWWLTAIDFGFELVSGGVGNNVHYYRLIGVN